MSRVLVSADTHVAVVLEDGDRVAIAMRNLPQWSMVFFAATMVGAIAVPLSASSRSSRP